MIRKFNLEEGQALMNMEEYVLIVNDMIPEVNRFIGEFISRYSYKYSLPKGDIIGMLLSMVIGFSKRESISCREGFSWREWIE